MNDLGQPFLGKREKRKTGNSCAFKIVLRRYVSRWGISEKENGVSRYKIYGELRDEEEPNVSVY